MNRLAQVYLLHMPLGNALGNPAYMPGPFPFPTQKQEPANGTWGPFGPYQPQPQVVQPPMRYQQFFTI